MTRQDTVLVLSDRPDLYGPVLDAMGKRGTFLPTVGLMTRELLSDPVCSGIILDVKLVMATDATARDKIFALCKDIPVIRSRVVPDAKAPLFIDPIEILLEVGTPATRRIEPRVKVRLEASWSLDADPAMTEPHEGVVLDISSSGAFLHAINALPGEDYLHLKIFEITHQRPIHCAVRWRMTTPQQGRMTGVGLKFLDISQAQLDEIQTICLNAG